MLLNLANLAASNTTMLAQFSLALLILILSGFFFNNFILDIDGRVRKLLGKDLAISILHSLRDWCIDLWLALIRRFRFFVL